MDSLTKRASQKIARKIIPFLMLCYFVAYLDRVNVGFAALTMNKDLGFTAEMFGFGAGIFFFGYFIFEVPSNLLLERFGARMWIARIMISWGIVSTADIGMKKVTPGIMKSAHSEVVALASRDLDKARAALAQLGLAKARAYGSYEELLRDPNIDAVYNPLPNHLHVPVTLAAATLAISELIPRRTGLEM